jgi:DNA-binding transcriptional MerR regulator
MPLKTSDIAKILGVHVNTVRLYEEDGFLPPIPRSASGYRQYSTIHLEQAKLVRLILHWPYLGDKELIFRLLRSAANGNYGTALELAFRYLGHIRMERTSTEAAIEFLEHWAAGNMLDTFEEAVYIGEAAKQLNVSLDMLRNWERNGLISVPREAGSGYRLYGMREFGRIRVIRSLLQAGYSLMAILRMLQAYDAGQSENLGEKLELPLEDSANEHIEVIADHWLSSLIDLESRAQAVIKQIRHLIDLSR